MNNSTGESALHRPETGSNEPEHEPRRVSIRISLEEFDRSHIPRLSQFICANPPKPQKVAGYRELQHPAPWELLVQSYFRSLRFPLSGEEVWIVLAHFKDQKRIIGAVGVEINLSENWALIKAVGIAQEFRHHRVASGVMPHLLRMLREHRPWMVIQANIHYKNQGSRRLFEGLGFSCVEYDGDYEIWELPVDP